MPCMVRVERRGKSPPVPQVTGGSCKLYPKQHRKENSAPGRRAGPVRFREVARGVWQQASQIDGCIDRTRLIGLLEKRRHPLWLPSFSVPADRYRAARSGPGDPITPPGCLDRAGQHHLIAPAPVLLPSAAAQYNSPGTGLVLGAFAMYNKIIRKKRTL